MAVMVQDSGKIMNYRQLMKHPKFNKHGQNHLLTILDDLPVEWVGE
jgi:hypothetical protein